MAELIEACGEPLDKLGVVRQAHDDNTAQRGIECTPQLALSC
jgi:hypothetical protein